MSEELTGRPVRESQSEMAEVVLPNDANPLNALLGGRLMHWIDVAGALAAHRHAKSYVVTASIDHMDFLTPVHVGDLVILRSTVNRVFNTSMEIGVKAFVENYITGDRRVVSTAYLTFVAVDRHGRRRPVPPVIPETDEENAGMRMRDAGASIGRRSGQERTGCRNRVISKTKRLPNGSRPFALEIFRRMGVQ